MSRFNSNVGFFGGRGLGGLASPLPPGLPFSQVRSGTGTLLRAPTAMANFVGSRFANPVSQWRYNQGRIGSNLDLQDIAARNFQQGVFDDQNQLQRDLTTQQILGRSALQDALLASQRQMQESARGANAAEGAAQRDNRMAIAEMEGRLAAQEAEADRVNRLALQSGLAGHQQELALMETDRATALQDALLEHQAKQARLDRDFREANDIALPGDVAGENALDRALQREIHQSKMSLQERELAGQEEERRFLMEQQGAESALLKEAERKAGLLAKDPENTTTNFLSRVFDPAYFRGNIPNAIETLRVNGLGMADLMDYAETLKPGIFSSGDPDTLAKVKRVMAAIAAGDQFERPGVDRTRGLSPQMIENLRRRGLVPASPPPDSLRSGVPY